MPDWEHTSWLGKKGGVMYRPIPACAKWVSWESSFTSSSYVMLPFGFKGSRCPNIAVHSTNNSNMVVCVCGSEWESTRGVTQSCYPSLHL